VWGGLCKIRQENITMMKRIGQDLESLCDALEHLKAELPRLTLSESVDVGARLRAAIKTSQEIDDIVKSEIKSKLRHKRGEIKGETFKAVLSLFPVDRLDQKALKELEPDTYERYVRTSTQERITFEAR
jgi:hypothetical protein